jgi:hypothetical protein
LVDEAAVLACKRRGAAIDLVLDRPKLARSQFVFTNARGRPAVWWQTQTTVQLANPGARVPRGRGAGTLAVAVDTREKYGWRFAGRPVMIERRALAGGDYGAVVNDTIVAVVERKTLANLATSLSDATWPGFMVGRHAWPIGGALSGGADRFCRLAQIRGGLGS